jgi:hypothetical protein
MTHFDDFLGLDARDLSRSRRVLFHGRSGSGKTTAIEHLLATQFRDRDVHRVAGPPYPGAPVAVQPGAVIAVDEIESLRDLRHLLRFARLDAMLMIATHVAPAFFPLAGIFPDAVFRTDRDREKVGRHLARSNVSASAAAIREYCRRFGATYTDADLIMERYPLGSFDAALARFLKFDDIVLSKRAHPVRQC